MAVNVPLQTLFANTRAGTVYQTTSAGGISAVSANTTRTAHWRGGKPHALFEPSRTNSVRNNTMVGAVAGTLSTTGVLPTNWSVFGMATSAVTVVGTGTEIGLPYIDLRFNGTPSAVPQVVFSASGSTAASSGQTWNISAFVKLQSGSLTNLSGAFVRLQSRKSGPFHASYDGSTFTPTSSIVRKEYTATLDDADGTGTIDEVQARLVLDWTSGAIDITLRIYAPQMEQGAFATSPILTSGSAVTRAADNATCSVSTFPIDQNGGSIRIIGRADYDTSGSGQSRIFQIDDGTDNNAIAFYIDEAAGTLTLDVIVGGSSQAAEALAYTSGAEFDAMLTFEEDNVFLSLNGSDSTPDTTASFPTGLLTTWRWGRSVAGDNGAAVLINQIASHSHEFSTTAANTITG